MPRFLIACMLLGSWCHAAAEETASPAAAPRYAAKIKFLKIDRGRQIMAVNTEVAGTAGMPLKTTLRGRNGLVLKLEMQDVAGSAPAQYLARFKLVETGRHKEIVLSEPTLVTTVGHPAKLMVGEKDGDRLELDLVVREVVGTQE
jgi:hypothetical protein